MHHHPDDRPHSIQPALGLGGWILLSIAAASTGAFVSVAGGWYDALVKPPWNPPSWVFGPVWTVLYLMMAVAAWIVWLRGGWAGQRRALTLYGTQLALNAGWTPLFFGMHAVGWALVDIALLWLALLATVARFWTVHRLAGLLLAPYLAWVTFAAWLNFTLWRLNG